MTATAVEYGHTTIVPVHFDDYDVFTSPLKDFTAVINPPHATILAVGTGEERAIVKNGKIEAAMMMSVTLSCDHRVVDGALGAELLAAFKALIENPVMMLV